jgi:hypothetical protein
MKKFIFLIYFIAVVLAAIPAHAQKAESLGSVHTEIQDDVIYPFFMALKNGDVDAFKNFFSTEMYNKNRILLEENTEYPEFLRSYYQGAEISVLKASEIAGDVEFDVLIEFADGSQSISKLRVSEQAKSDKTINAKKNWKIGSMESIR